MQSCKELHKQSLNLEHSCILCPHEYCFYFYAGSHLKWHNLNLFYESLWRSRIIQLKNFKRKSSIEILRRRW
ncbi:unnamed protein product [Blepharisma stoltei]|uniref:Uncharacterized protein n=1 Tax=Blepharisma stoltei TaxID=1481888 RepID=A0AAU9K7H4_9CILI|nr:unnamed protein product [Blepharisma stoltei]